MGDVDLIVEGDETTQISRGDEDEAIAVWRTKRLIRSLDAARGGGTSVISLIIPPRDQLARAAKLLAEEAGTASNIKSRVNRQSVLAAISSAQQRLKLYNKVPPNGLIIYSGIVMTEDGKAKRVNFDIEPFKPVHSSLYMCDNRFHTEPLKELLQSDEKFGFVIMDGSGTLFGVVSGNNREVLHRVSVELPKKHGRGGQSALRFARLRTEKRRNYLRKITELCVQFFITNDRVNVTGIVLAGLADLKTELYGSDLLDPRLKVAVIKVVDVSYGGDNGFNQAIELSADVLSNVKLMHEKKLIIKFFDEIGKDTGKFCYGLKDTMAALDMRSVETLIVWENLEMDRYVVRNKDTLLETVLFLTPDQVAHGDFFRDKVSGVDLDIISKMQMTEWLAENYRGFGTSLEFVTDRSQEGSQFCRGFGGLGGILRYRVELDDAAAATDFVDGDDEKTVEDYEADFI